MAAKKSRWEDLCSKLLTLMSHNQASGSICARRLDRLGIDILQEILIISSPTQFFIQSLIINHSQDLKMEEQWILLKDKISDKNLVKTWRYKYAKEALCKYIKGKSWNSATIELQIALSKWENIQHVEVLALLAILSWGALEIDFREKFPPQILLKHHKLKGNLKHWIKDWCCCIPYFHFIPFVPPTSLFRRFRGYLLN